jgi:L-threonine synthase (EC 4.2.3.1)
VTLGEGWTPLVAAPDRDASYKLEALFPTASFKDRGAAVTLSQAAAFGVDRVVEDSSGNAGAAIATYAARAGIDAEIFVPADAKPGKLAAIERSDATVRRVEGSRQDVTDACIATVEADTGENAWYASHAWQPSFLEGTATFAYEVAAQRDWAVPDAVVTPLGHGTLFLGAYLGFRRLHRAGWTDGVPRLYGAQAAGIAPIVASDTGTAPRRGQTNSPTASRYESRPDGVRYSMRSRQPAATSSRSTARRPRPSTADSAGEGSTSNRRVLLRPPRWISCASRAQSAPTRTLSFR